MQAHEDRCCCRVRGPRGMECIDCGDVVLMEGVVGRSAGRMMLVEKMANVLERTYPVVVVKRHAQLAEAGHLSTADECEDVSC